MGWSLVDLYNFVFNFNFDVAAFNNYFLFSAFPFWRTVRHAMGPNSQLNSYYNLYKNYDQGREMLLPSPIEVKNTCNELLNTVFEKSNGVWGIRPEFIRIRDSKFKTNFIKKTIEVRDSAYRIECMRNRLEQVRAKLSHLEEYSASINNSDIRVKTQIKILKDHEKILDKDCHSDFVEFLND